MYIDAPASVVAAALLETVAGDEFRLIEASARRVHAVSAARELTADLTSTPHGTEITGGDRSLLDRIDRRARELASARIVVATAIVRDREVLAQQRAFPPETAGRWELPGGRVEPGESEVAAVRRECLEELGVTVEPGAQFGPDVVLAGGKYLLRSYRAELVGGEPKPREHQAVRWLRRGGLGELDWLPADRVLLLELRTLL